MPKASGIAIAIAVAMIATACSGGASKHEVANASGVTTRPPSAETKAFAEKLAEVGVAVYEAPNDAAPIVPLHAKQMYAVTRHDAEQMASEVAGGAGISGAQFDDLVATADGSWRPSALVAVWAAKGPSATAQLARSLLVHQDLKNPPAVVFPTAVLTLFAVDAANRFQNAKQASLRAAPDAVLAVARPRSVLDTLCSSAQKFVNDSLDSIAHAIEQLKIPALQTGIGPLDWFVNGLLNLGLIAVKAAANKALAALRALAQEGIDTVLGYIADAASIAIVAQTIWKVIQPWNMGLVADPTNTHTGVAPQAGEAGQVELKVSPGAGPTDWPPIAKDCANAAGKPLPPFGPSGNKVAWKADASDLVAVGAQDARLDEQASARLHYTTTVEDKTTARGKSANTTVTVGADVNRDNLDPLAKRASDFLAGLALKLVPPFLRGIVEKYVKEKAGDAVAFLIAQIEKIRVMHVRPVTIRISYHQRQEPVSFVAFNHYRGKIKNFGLEAPPEFGAWSCDGLDGHWHGMLWPYNQVGGGFPVDFQFQVDVAHVKVATPNFKTTGAGGDKSEAQFTYDIRVRVQDSPDPSHAGETVQHAIITGTDTEVGSITFPGTGKVYRTDGSLPIEKQWNLSPPPVIEKGSLNELLTRLEPYKNAWAHAQRTLSAIQCGA